MDRKPTMNDVARLAGVGTMTVSRVLNDSAPVSAEAAERVYRAIEQLGYRPNEMARALRGVKSRSIGMIVPHLYDSFFATIAHEINTVAREHGYSVILATSDEDPDLEFTEAELMLQRRVDGLIVIPAEASRSRLIHAEFDRTHIVTLDRPTQARRFDSVLVENQRGGRQAVEHLIGEHGHRHIVFIALNRQLYTMRARFDGYRRAMIEAGLRPESSFKCATQELTSAAIGDLMRQKDPPTAFFCANNLTTRYALRALLDLGVCVPEEVALIGFDDFELAEILQPTLTVVRQPVYELGRVAAGMLFDRLDRDEFPSDGNKVVLPVELVIRRSCGCRTGVRAAAAD